MFFSYCIFLLIHFLDEGCGDPGTPENGRKLGVTYSKNSVVYFNCDLGYELFGSPDRKCQANGTWAGVQPICKGGLQDRCPWLKFNTKMADFN